MTPPLPTKIEADEEREEGMQRALDRANRKVANWSDLAYQFLERYARQHGTFISEDVSEASKQWGMEQPPTDRAWGGVYRRAQKGGVITPDGTGRSKRRHNTICLRWRSLIFCVPAT